MLWTKSIQFILENKKAKEECYKHIVKVTTYRLTEALLNYKPKATEVSLDPYLVGRAYLIEVRNRPMAYILEAEEKGRKVSENQILLS